MKLFVYLTSVISVFLSFGCHSNIEDKALETKLMNLKIEDAFSLDTLNKLVLWDQLYIVGPYQYEVINQKANIPDDVRDITLTEVHCVLVFMKDGYAVSYSSIPRGVIDFCDFNGNGDFNDDNNAVQPNTVFILKEGRRAILN